MKQSKASIFREWRLPEGYKTNHLRYQNPIEKGIYWYWLSIYVRQRDVEAWGTCISCNKPITFETCQAGHFMPAASCGRDLLFDLRNVNAECGPCNAWDETHLLGYAQGLNKRFGEGTAEVLQERRRLYLANKVPVKDWKGEEYAIKIKELPSYQQALASPLELTVL